MKIRIVSSVNKNYKEVFAGFSGELFEYLAPKGQLKLLRFDGCEKGDVIEIEFIKPLKARWVSEITATYRTEDELYFIDEGKKLPYGLKEWKHKHLVRKTGKDTCEIIDEINYKGTNWLISIFHFIPLYLSFYQRKAKYRSYFEW